MVSILRRWLKPLVVGQVHRRNERTRRELIAAGRALSPRDWDAQAGADGSLILANCPLMEVARRFGTPLHVVDERRLAGNFRRFRDAFADQLSRLEVGFSYKTNPLPGAIRILHDAGAFAEVISHYELWLARRLGISGERIVFNGPGKTADGLRLAVETGVRMINIDNIDEAALIDDAARGRNRRQAVGVRIVTSVGWAAQFGLPLADGAALAAFDAIGALSGLEPRGLHIHLGTGIKDVATYIRAVDEVFAFAKFLKNHRRIDIDFIDLGGGFGVPTVAPITPMDERLLAMGLPAAPVDPAATPPLSVYAAAIGQRVRDHFGTAAPTIFFEPGRAVSSSAQALLLTVLAVKPGQRGRRNVILDGGHNLAIPTSYEIHQIFPVEGLNQPADAEHDFFGPLCHPGDVLARAIPMRPLAAGDVVAVMDAGAYFISNQMNFSNPRPAVVIVKDGAVRLTRAAESFEAMVSLDRELDEEAGHGT